MFRCLYKLYIYSSFHTHKVYNLFIFFNKKKNKNNENIKIIVIVNIISTYAVH